MIELLSDPQIWVSFLTLTVLELVLGIDNVIFISILVEKLPKRQRAFARMLGLSLAMLMRIGLLFTVSWQVLSGRDLILIAGGLFLLWKSTQEIHHAFDREEDKAPVSVRATL